MAKNYEIWVAGDSMTITATAKEAKAYACGMIEAFRLMGAKERVQMYDEFTGNKVFERQC